MESRLKQDVLREAQEYGNQIMVAHEDDDYQIVQKWEAVTEVDVQTPLDVYQELEGRFLETRLLYCMNRPSLPWNPGSLGLSGYCAYCSVMSFQASL